MCNRPKCNNYPIFDCDCGILTEKMSMVGPTPEIQWQYYVVHLSDSEIFTEQLGTKDIKYSIHGNLTWRLL